MPQLVHPKETLYFSICLVFSVFIYLLLLFTIVGILYVLILAFFVWFSHGIIIGGIKGNAVRVSERQMPELHRLASGLAQKMELPLPEIYIVESGGVLNAFATRFLSRNFVIIYADILELALEQGEEEVAFILAHELAHLKRKHLSLRWLIYPGLLIPFLNTAYLRACEYTCDRFGAHYCPKGAITGLVVLAAGKKLYRKVDLEEFVAQAAAQSGFWTWLAEILATHPHLTKRVGAVKMQMRVTPPVFISA